MNLIQADIEAKNWKYEISTIVRVCSRALWLSRCMILCLKCFKSSCFRRLRQEIAARIMLQLCFALFVVVVLFLTGLERTNQPNVCVAIGIAIHYFTLVAFMWMFMEAVFMYHAFVIVWPPREDNDVLKCSLAAWGKNFWFVREP